MVRHVRWRDMALETLRIKLVDGSTIERHGRYNIDLMYESIREDIRSDIPIVFPTKDGYLIVNYQNVSSIELCRDQQKW